jgi:hypothetical protein
MASEIEIFRKPAGERRNLHEQRELCQPPSLINVRQEFNANVHAFNAYRNSSNYL